VQVQALLKKLSGLKLNMICPLHGPILKENLEYYINKYDVWSKYEPEDDGVFIAYASIHGNTEEAARLFAKVLEENGARNVSLSDLSRCDMAEAIEDAFRYDKLILASSSYDGGVFTPMEQFLRSLKSKNYQNRKIGIIENGIWAPSAARCMKEVLSEMKNLNVCENVVTIRGAVKNDTSDSLDILAKEILK